MSNLPKELKTGVHAPGRPRSIPGSLFDTVLQLYASGYGYRSIATHLRGLGMSTTHTTVRRLLKAEGAYAKCSSAEGLAECRMRPEDARQTKKGGMA